MNEALWSSVFLAAGESHPKSYPDQIRTYWHHASRFIDKGFTTQISGATPLCHGTFLIMGMTMSGGGCVTNVASCHITWATWLSHVSVVSHARYCTVVWVWRCLTFPPLNSDTSIDRVLDIAKMVQITPITLQQLQNYRVQNRMAQPSCKSGELLRNCRPQLPAPKVNKRL